MLLCVNRNEIILTHRNIDLLTLKKTFHSARTHRVYYAKEMYFSITFSFSTFKSYVSMY